MRAISAVRIAFRRTIAHPAWVETAPGFEASAILALLQRFAEDPQAR
jgi:hypothetical protein